MPRIRSVLALVLALSGALISSCQGDDPPADGVGGQGGAGPLGTKASKIIGEEGGKIATENASLTFPSGALRKPTEITLAELSADQSKTLPTTEGGVKQLGFPVKFTPHGLTFDQPVDVTMGFPAPDPEDTPVVAMKLDNDQDPSWEFVPDAKFDSGEANFQITSFSIYCIFEDPDGMAEMLYGPVPTGSGGDTGSGGESSAGSGGSGGTAGSGGSAGSGGAGSGGDGSGGFPGLGGMGGAGAVSGLNGYLDTPTFHGYGYTEVGVGATITADFDKPGPNCAFGQTGATSAGQASLVYYVNQGTDHIEFGPLFVPDKGLKIASTVANERGFLVELRSEYPPAVWCAYPSTNVEAFLPWESFDAQNCPGSLAQDAFDPALDSITKVAVTEPSNGEVVQSFDFCISELTTGLPNGYMDGPTWFGFGEVLGDGSSNVYSDLYEVVAPNCINGTTLAPLYTYAELGYYLDQSVSGAQAYPVLLQGTGLMLDLLMSYDRDLEVRLSTGYTAEYCYALPAAASGTVTIPWGDFVFCGSSGQFDPAYTAVTKISVRVLSSGADEPYDLCIERLEAEVPIDL